MKDTDIFTAGGYDIVIAIPQKTINEQIRRLAGPGFIVALTANEDDGNGDGGVQYAATSYRDFGDVPKDLGGKPTTSVINAQYTPSIDIRSSGTTVDLELRFTSGDAYFPDPLSGRMRKYSIVGWTYAVAVPLVFTEITSESLKTRARSIPDMARKSLEELLDGQYAVSQLFLDFGSVDSMRYDPDKTQTGSAGHAALNPFTLFMSQYLSTVAKDRTENPYVLGYVIKTTPASSGRDDYVPSSLKPIGNTFTVSRDPSSPDRNTLNFILNTETDRHQRGRGDHPSPRPFDTKWMNSNEYCQAKTIYSSDVFLESLVLRPFYSIYSSNTHDKLVSNGLALGPDNSYDEAKSPINHGFHFEIAAVSGTTDDYDNNYEVTWAGNDGGGFELNFRGNIHLKKRNAEDLGSKTAVAWCEGWKPWTAVMSFACHSDDAGRPFIRVSNPVLCEEDGHQSTTKNKWVDAIGPSVMTDMFGKFLDYLDSFAEPGFFAKAFDDFITSSHGDAGTPPLETAMRSLFTATKKSFMLPAGDVLFFKNATVLDGGPVAMELTYKADDGQ